MKKDTVNREMQEELSRASAELHAVTVFEGHDLADSPGGKEAIWLDLRSREFGMTPTLAHILKDTHLPSGLPIKRL